MSGDYDHYVVALDLTMQLVPSSSLTRPRRAQYDRNAARADPGALRMMLQTMPSVAWGVGVDEHWRQLEAHCSAFLRKHFPRPKRQMRQEFFSTTTWSTLTSRKEVDIQIKAVDRSIAQWSLHKFFSAWKQNKTPTHNPLLQTNIAVVNLYQEKAVLLWARSQLAASFRHHRNEDLRRHRATSDLHFQACIGSGNASALYKALRPKRPVNRDHCLLWILMAPTPLNLREEGTFEFGNATSLPPSTPAPLTFRS